MGTHKKSFHYHFKFASMIALVAIIVPVVSQPLIGSVLGSERDPFAVKADVMKKAAGERSKLRAKKRAFVEASDNCVEMRANTGDNITCPGVNDTSDFLSFTPPRHSAAPQESDPRFSQLSDREQAIVQQSVDNGVCSERLIARGLYRLCKSILEKIDAPRGFMNDKAYLQLQRAISNPTDLRTLIKQSKNSRGTITERENPETSHFKAK